MRRTRRSAARRAAACVLAAAVLLLGACASRTARRTLPAPSADDFVRSGLLPIGRNRAEIRAVLGAPAHLTLQTVPNRHVAGVTDTLVVLSYPGLAVHLHRPGMADAQDLVSRVDVSDGRYLRYARPTIGTSMAELERLLGPPAKRGAESVSYDCRSCEGADAPVEFVIQGGRVSEIHFHYYVD